MKLIFAQGNPGPEHTLSRHNVGFLMLDTIANMHGVKWAAKAKFNASIAEFELKGEKVIIAKPFTFYNETGVSARKLIDFYKINPETDLLVLHDDLALPFGTVRVRQQGGDAGNNGIKSINAHVAHNYTRIKIGIGVEDRVEIDDSAFVLAKFTNQELGTLIEKIIPHTIKLVVQFCNNSLQLTSYKNIE